MRLTFLYFSSLCSLDKKGNADELHHKDGEMHSQTYVFSPVVYKDDVIYICDSAESTGRVVLVLCWVFSMSPASPSCASTDHFL